jgi:hypothetical protein
VSSAAQLFGIPAKKWSEEFMRALCEAGKKDSKYRKALEDLEKKVALAGPMPIGSNAEEEAILPCEEQQLGRMAGKDILGITEGLLY